MRKAGGHKKFRFFPDISILAKLLILSAFVTAGLAATIVVSARGFDSLAAGLEHEQANSIMSTKATAVARLSYDLQIKLQKAIAYGMKEPGSMESQRAVYMLGNVLEAGTSIIDELAALDSVEGSFQSLSESIGLLEDGVVRDEAKTFDAVRATSGSARLAQAAAAAVSLAIVALVILMTVRSITKLLAALLRFIEKAGTGDLAGGSGIKGRDETGKIAASVDLLLADLRAMIGTVKERVVALEEEGESLSSTMEETGQRSSRSTRTSRTPEDSSRPSRPRSAASSPRSRSGPGGSWPSPG